VRAQATATRRFSVDARGGPIVGWERGEGTPALVLHGGPISDYTEPLVQALPGSLRAVRYQQRGLAPSTVAGPLGVESHVEDAVRVLDGVGIERALAIGHSWGAHLAFHLAAAIPQRLLGVIGIDPLGAVPDGGWSDLDRNLAARLEQDSPAAAKRAQELDRRGMAGEASDEELRESFDLAWPYYFADPASAPAPPQVALSVELYAGVVASVFEHFERGTLTSALPRFDGPFLLVHGERDPLPLEASRATAALVPHARLVTIAGSGHFPWLEQPERFQAAVRGFLQDVAALG
jgi:pimeloyl-ACP methyl ester carboxylesterase